MADTPRMKAIREKAAKRKAASEKAIADSVAEAEKKLEAEQPVEQEEGFFSSFFGRSEAVDAVVEAAETGDDTARLRKNQSTDSNN